MVNTSASLAQKTTSSTVSTGVIPAAALSPQALPLLEQWTQLEGTPYPLGVRWLETEKAYNFALYSQYASNVTLLLYSASDPLHPVTAKVLDPLQNKSGRIWHCRISETDMTEAHYYAYRVDGPPPNGRFEWNTFDSQKILLDPYAWSVYFPPGFDRGACTKAGATDGKAPLGLICKTKETYDWGTDVIPQPHESDAVIYEMHVRGFTKNPNSAISPEKQGTFAGVIEKIPHLQDLGVTLVELMPVYQCDPQEGSVWGYMPLNFFSPHAGYAVDSNPAEVRNEFRDMVKALHAVGIEVILDVVYNHTCENNSQGPLYSYKGIDNSTYYMSSEDPAAEPYANYSGTGNTLNCANPAVRKLILDSMRYWVKEMHVDGFRFDLASILSRNSDGSLNTTDPPIFSDIAADPDLNHIRLIAEPWDAGGGYELGVPDQVHTGFPGMTWLQWNDQYRSDLQGFVKSDGGLVGELITRLYGSDDLFPDQIQYAYHAYQSVNYINSHDGFTLYDQVSYNNKVNPNDGSTPISWNCGWDGDQNVPADVIQLRRRQAKNFCTLLFLSNGTPMFRAGDEFLQTQFGNNNPYNNDQLNWLDWSRLQTEADHYRFFKQMIAFRKTHPTLCRSRFWREDVQWFGTGPQIDLSEDSHTLAFYLNGARFHDINLYVLINSYWDSLEFTIQASGPWKRVIDTSLDSPEDFMAPGQEVLLTSTTYSVGPRSVVVLIQ